MPPVIGIDARAAAEVPAGGGRYVRELLRGLAALPECGDQRFVLFARSRWNDPALDGRFAWRLVDRPDPVWNVGVGLRAANVCDVFCSTTSYLTAWFTGVPTACVVFDLIALRHPELTQNRARRIERATLGPAVRRAAALPCISEATRRDLVAEFPHASRKASVITLAAAAADGEVVPAPPGRPYVLAVGTIEPRKNLKRLIIAWEQLPQTLRDRHDLVLVGPRGWDDDGITARARRAGARMTGFVPDAELRGLYRGARAFAYPALYEGFGLPVIEAMSEGAPVITSTTSALPEVAGSAALLVDPLDVTALSRAIERVLTEPGLREDLARRGLAQAARFSWARTARETYGLLREIAR